VIDVAARTVSITRAGRTTVLRAAASLPTASRASTQVESCTLTVAALQQLCAAPQFLSEKALRQGCAGTLVFVEQIVAASSALCAILFSAEFSTASPALDPDALQKLLDEKGHVFQPLPPGLLPERGSGHVIPTVPNMPPPLKRPYRMTLKEKEEVQRQVTDLLQRGLIEPSVSPYGAPVLFVQKKDGFLRMCTGYRQHNKSTVRDSFPLPHIQDLLDQVSQCTIFSSLDLQSGYNQI
jgi:hypothetical protein